MVNLGKSMKTLLRVAIVAIAVTSLAFGGTTGKLTGKVTDAKTKVPIPFANIVIEGTSLGAAADVEGNYVILNIPPARYTVKVSQIGFQPVSAKDVSISIDLTTRQDFDLSEGSIELQEIVVQSKRDVLKKDVTSSQSLASSEKISALPVVEFNDVLQLQAGVTKDADGGFHIRGGRSSEIAYWVNGVSITDPYDNSRGLNIDNSSVQELQVISGTFNAEYGNAMSGIVNTVTKEGGKETHGGFNIYSGDYVSDPFENFVYIEHYNPLTNYNFQGNLSGEIPLTERKVTFFLNGRYVYDDGYKYGFHKYNLDGSKSDGHAVPMNWSRRWLGQANVAYQLFEGIKINTELLYSKENYQDYNHFFKWNPDGNPLKFANSYNGTLILNHVLTPQTFYTVHASYFFKDFRQRLFSSAKDSRYMHPDSLLTIGYAFVTKGTDLHRFFRETQYLTTKFDFTTQASEHHLMQLGVEGTINRLRFDDYTLEPLRVGGVPVTPFVPSIPDESSINRNKYEAKPFSLSSYVQDKVEFNNVIVNVGFRLDYFDSRGKVLVDPRDPNINIPLRNGLDTLTLAQRESYFYRNATAKWQISPRFGVAYPISEFGVVHFSYGHFLQIPTFQYLFDGGSYKVPETGSVGNPFGNPGLQPQKTVMYEIGFRQQFSSDYVADVTGFYRDIRDWITAGPPTATLNGVTYSVYTNKDYSNVRGITLNFNKRFSNHFSFDLNYTYQVAEGSNSNPDDEFRAAQNNQQPTIYLRPLNWDKTHNMNVNFLVGDADWGISLLAQYGTGLPYTPSITQYTSDRGLSTGFEPNSRRRPDQFTIDLKANKTLKVSGTDFTLYLKVFNLLNTRTIVNVWGDTGEPDYTTSVQNISEDPKRPNTVAEYIAFPDFYGPPRLVQTGIEFSF